MKKSLFVLLLCLVFACSHDSRETTLQAGKWSPLVRQALNELIAGADKDSYAVFDFDQTSIVHDISQALWVYQIENLLFAGAPEHLFLDGVPDKNVTMPGTDITYAQMGAVLAEEFDTLKAMKDGGESLSTIRNSNVYLDFRARMYSLMLIMDEQYGSWVTYLWQPGLLAGFTYEEALGVIKDAITEHLGLEKLAVEHWASPDGQWGGEVQRGIWVSPEMKDLYKCLRASGIDVYICSASLELIVEVLACDPVLGFGMPADKVYGLRFVDGETIVPEFDPGYHQPNREGKVDCINAYMAPEHGNHVPSLVAGDSNGDVAMLTGFADMKKGLIIDVGRSASSAIGQLATQAKDEGNFGRYLLQPSFEK